MKKIEIILNCLAKDLNNAKEIYEESNGNALVGLLTKSFATDELYVAEANDWVKELDGNISIGLGGGDHKQSFMVTRVSKLVNANHINQVFTGVGATIQSKKNKDAIVNALISPTGIVGKVKISTGPESSELEDAIVDARTAMAMIKDMGGNSIKFFNMGGLKHWEEAKHIINLCVEYDFIFEPTGGLSLDNVEEMLSYMSKAGIKKTIVHIYSSIIKNGSTDIESVKTFWKIAKKY